MADELGALYTERAHLVALLARQFPSLISYSDPAEPDWAVVFIETPEGQLSWHISPADMGLFGQVRMVPADMVKWDGHSTEEKYERIRRLVHAA